jgi:YVTN family beta-propeller protein
MKFKTGAVALGLAVALAACSKQEETTTLGAAEQATTQTAPQAVAYVSQQDGPVAIYSLADYTKIGQIKVGKGAHGLGLTEDGKLLVLAVKESKDLAIVDTATNKVVRRVPVGLNPEFVRVQGNLAFVAYQPAHVAIIDLLKGEKIREITTGQRTENIEFSSDGKHMIVTNEANDNLSVYDIETGEKINQIDTESHGIRPGAIKRSPDGEHFVVTLEYSNKILILDESYDVIHEASTGEVPFSATYTRDGSEIVVALARGKAIQVFDSKTLALTREIPVGERCLHFGFTPDDKHLIVACSGSENIMVLDYSTGTLIKDISESNIPLEVIISPKPAESKSSPG